MDKLMENLDTEVNYLLQKAGKEVFCAHSLSGVEGKQICHR